MTTLIAKAQHESRINATLKGSADLISSLQAKVTEYGFKILGAEENQAALAEEKAKLIGERDIALAQVLNMSIKLASLEKKMEIQTGDICALVQEKISLQQELHTCSTKLIACLKRIEVLEKGKKFILIGRVSPKTEGILLGAGSALVAGGISYAAWTGMVAGAEAGAAAGAVAGPVGAAVGGVFGGMIGGVGGGVVGTLIL